MAYVRLLGLLGVACRDGDVYKLRPGVTVEVWIASCQRAGEIPAQRGRGALFLGWFLWVVLYSLTHMPMGISSSSHNRRIAVDRSCAVSKIIFTQCLSHINRAASVATRERKKMFMTTKDPPINKKKSVFFTVLTYKYYF